MEQQPLERFREMEEYREQLEMKHLRSKNHLVLILIVFMLLITTLYMLVVRFPIVYYFSLLAGYLVLILFNITCLAYGSTDTSFYTINKFITSLGVFGIATAMIFIFQSPVFIAGLFIAYAIAAFYQDIKVIIVSDIYLLFTIVMIAMNYPQYMAFTTGLAINDMGTFFFIALFLILLTISSYIIIKQKRFLYRQIALSKEGEFRNIDLLIDAKNEATKTKTDELHYYKTVDLFTKAFCEKLSIDNVFSEKIKIMSMLAKNGSFATIQAKYPSYSDDELRRLQDLSLTSHHKLRKIIIKYHQTKELDIKRREMFSEMQLKSFNHTYDSLEIKVLAFSVFYVSLRLGFDLQEPLSSDDVLQTLSSTDFYYVIDTKIMKLFIENHLVFDAIIRDQIEGGLK